MSSAAAALLPAVDLDAQALSIPPEDLSNQPWRLWLDATAGWEDDEIFLPDDVDLSRLPVHAPTGGWASLDESKGIAVTLPGTVEEHLAVLFDAGNPAPKGAVAGNPEAGSAYYRGVSWWWRSFDAPVLRPGQRAVIAFRGARLRAEVYCNARLCGYTIMTELPFEADVTDALQVGSRNLLAVRITNPGGFLAWNDLEKPIQWGRRAIPGSHGYGGLDRSVVLEVRDPVFVSDLTVLNLPDLRTVRLVVEVSSSGAAYSGPVALAIVREGRQYWSGTIDIKAEAGKKSTVALDARVDDAQPWTLGSPVLYRASARLQAWAQGGREVDFGFRFLTAEGIGSDARLVFNGKRIVLRSAISWGHWGINGLWPTPAMAQKEVAAAKSLGLNCLQAHRNLAKPEVLDLQDRQGLLRYEEPGGGAWAFEDKPFNAMASPPTPPPVDTSGAGGEPRNFTDRYACEKLLRMVRRDRSHPSLIIYCLQNELSPDLRNPRIFRMMRRMHELDPSRIIVLKSGDQPQNEALMLPWSETILHDDGTVRSGWLDLHSATINPGGYVDANYRGPDDYLHHSRPDGWASGYSVKDLPWYRSENRGEIVMWGEMGGVGVPDDHQAIAQWYRQTGRTGYERAYHERMAAAYGEFLDRRGFRGEFPTATAVFRAVGEKSYFFWQKALEQGRMDGGVDYLVVSGWESTAVDNHSGIVDGHRNFRADPATVREATLPEVLVVRARQYVLNSGETAVVDVHLISETGRSGAHRLRLRATDRDGKSLLDTQHEVQVQGGDRFGQFLRGGFEVPTGTGGMVALEASLAPRSGAGAELRHTEKILVVEAGGVNGRHTVALAGGSWAVSDAALVRSLGVEVAAAGKAPVILYKPQTSEWSRGRTGSAVSGASDPGLFRFQLSGAAGVMAHYRGLAKGPCHVELLFAETSHSSAGMRSFDVAINGHTVLEGFDPFAEAGGRYRQVDRRFTVEAPDGEVWITVPKVGRDAAIINGVKVTDAGGRTITQSANGTTFKDAAGQIWEPLPTVPRVPLPELPGLLEHVSRDGARLVVWPDDTNGARIAAQTMGELGILKFEGMLGGGGADWQGSWYLVRRHWLFDGLPDGCAMDWRYQVAAGSSDGLLIDAPGMETAAAYGRYEEARIAVGVAVIPHGRGQIVLYCLPGLQGALTGKASGIHPVAARRLLINAIQGGDPRRPI